MHNEWSVTQCNIQEHIHSLLSVVSTDKGNHYNKSWNLISSLGVYLSQLFFIFNWKISAEKYMYFYLAIYFDYKLD